MAVTDHPPTTAVVSPSSDHQHHCPGEELLMVIWPVPSRPVTRLGNLESIRETIE